MKRFVKKKLRTVNDKTDNFEFNKIGKVISKIFVNKSTASLLDVGSGLGDFSQYISENYTWVDITCLDINQDLVDIAISSGFNAIKGDMTTLPFQNECFDIVHCSHVIEHLDYPKVVEALDELCRVVKKNGIIIIRTPLWVNHRFYNDIDHIRPYPPNAIINYFNNPQQQRLGKVRLVEVDRWYVRIFKEIDSNRYPVKITKYVNVLLRLSWVITSYPRDRPNNYGIVFKKV